MSKEATPDTTTDAASAADPEAPAAPQTGIPRKTWIILGVVTAVVWAFAINTGSPIVLAVVGALTLVLIGPQLWISIALSKRAFARLRQEHGLGKEENL